MTSNDVMKAKKKNRESGDDYSVSYIDNPVPLIWEVIVDRARWHASL